MTPTQLEAAMRRAGVGQYENMTGKPYPYKSRLEEAEAILAELGPDETLRNGFLGLLIAVDNASFSALAEAEDGSPEPEWQTDLWDSADEARRVLDAYAAAEPAKEGAEG